MFLASYSFDCKDMHLYLMIVNILYVGGSVSYPSSAKYLYSKIKESNKNGDFIPLWGTCMGFQWLLISQSGKKLHIPTLYMYIDG